MITPVSLVEHSSNVINSLNEESQKVKTDEIYFCILYQRNEKEKEKDFLFTKYESEPAKIYSKEINGQNGIFLYEKVFKLKRKKKKKEDAKKHGDSKTDESKKKKGAKKEEDNKKDEEAKNKDKKKKDHKNKDDKKNDEEIEIQFQIGEKDNYFIKFNAEDKSFYFDIELKRGNKFLKYIAKEEIDQNIINYKKIKKKKK